MGEFKSTQLELTAGAMCSTPDCIAIISRLAGVVRERMRKEPEWGLNDAYLAAKYGLLDFAECAAKALTFGIKGDTFETMYRLSRPSLLKQTAFIWRELRKLIIERDERCTSCNKPPNQVHHINWLSRGGHPLDPCNLRSLCSKCHTDQSRCSRSEKAMSPLKGTTLIAGEAVNPRLSRIASPRFSVSQAESPQLGHRPTKSELFNHWEKIRGLVFELLGTWKRTEMVMFGLKMQATRGKCFASAATIASFGNGHKKTWDRLSAFLRSQDLLSTARLMRKNRSLSTNLTDFSLLWSLLLKLLKGTLPKLERLGDGSLWAKLNGEWRPLPDVLLESLPPPEARTQPPLL
jgi:hypothetical protein